MNVTEILREWLEANEFDGLCHNETECGCHLQDFIICGGDGGALPQCEPAYKFVTKDGGWWMSTNKNWVEKEQLT